MTEKWTPVPWFKDKYGFLRGANGKQVGVWDSGIAHVSRDAESEANTRLMAAAPDLYRALEGMLRLADAANASDRIICHEARLALAKARGEA